MSYDEAATWNRDRPHGARQCVSCLDSLQITSLGNLPWCLFVQMERLFDLRSMKHFFVTQGVKNLPLSMQEILKTKVTSYVSDLPRSLTLWLFGTRSTDYEQLCKVSLNSLLPRANQWELIQNLPSTTKVTAPFTLSLLTGH